MGVYHEPYAFLEPGSQYDVGGFPGDSRQREELVHVIGNLSAELADDLLRRTDHGPRFVAEKTGGADVRLELLGGKRGKVLGRRILPKQHRRDAIDIYVGGLRRKNGRDQQFPGIAMGQRAGDIGIKLVQTLQDFLNALSSAGIVAFAGPCWLGLCQCGDGLYAGRPVERRRSERFFARTAP